MIIIVHNTRSTIGTRNRRNEALTVAVGRSKKEILFASFNDVRVSRTGSSVTFIPICQSSITMGRYQLIIPPLGGKYFIVQRGILWIGPTIWIVRHEATRRASLWGPGSFAEGQRDSWPPTMIHSFAVTFPCSTRRSVSGFVRENVVRAFFSFLSTLSRR